MAAWYLDYEDGDDTNGDGSAANPYQTFDKVTSVAANHDEIRWAGKAEVVLSATWTWTNASASLTAPGDQTAEVAVGDFLRPSRTDTWANPRYRATACAYDSGTDTTTVTLHTPYVDFPGAATWQGSTVKTPYIVLAATMGWSAPSADAFTVTGGWRLSDETQPEGWVSAFTAEGGSYCWCKAGNWYYPDISRFYWANLGSLLYASRSIYAKGVMDYAGVSSFDSRSASFEDIVTTGACQMGYLDAFWANRIYVVTNTSLGFAMPRVGELHLGTAALETFCLPGQCGRVVAHGPIQLYNQQAYPTPFSVGELDSNGQTANVVTYFDRGPVVIGAPLADWQYSGAAGKIDRATGRGGTGYSLRFNPALWTAPLMGNLATLAAAGEGVTLRFWCYYSGTAGDVPECSVIAAEPDGLEIARVPFTPPNGTDWSAAAEQVVTLAGTTLQTGSLQVVVCVHDNVAEDAVVYVDDVTWTGAGDVADTSGLEAGGLVRLVQAIDTGGAAFPVGL